MTFLDQAAVASKALETSSRFLPLYVVTSMFKRNMLRTGLGALHDGLLTLSESICRHRMVLLNPTYGRCMAVFVFNGADAIKIFDRTAAGHPSANYGQHCCSPLMKETMEMTDLGVEPKYDRKVNLIPNVSEEGAVTMVDDAAASTTTTNDKEKEKETAGTNGGGTFTGKRRFVELDDGSASHLTVQPLPSAVPMPVCQHQSDDVLTITVYIKFGFYQRALRWAQQFVGIIVPRFPMRFYSVLLQYETGRSLLVVAFATPQDLQNYQRSGALLDFTNDIRDCIRSVPLFETWKLVYRN
jgi:hypothetical protein